MPGLIEAGCRERLLVGRRGSDVRVSADAAVLAKLRLRENRAAVRRGRGSSSARAGRRQTFPLSKPTACRRCGFPARRAPKHLKGLILAQNERWWRGLGMQVVREGPARGRTAANGVVRRRDVPSGPG